MLTKWNLLIYHYCATVTFLIIKSNFSTIALEPPPLEKWEVRHGIDDVYYIYLFGTEARSLRHPKNYYD